MTGARGSASVWLLCGCLLIGSAGAAALLLGSAVLARHRAGTVADLAALAAARAQASGEPDPCARAARVARASAAVIQLCVLEATSVLVVAEVQARVPGMTTPARARARAGVIESGAAVRPPAGQGPSR